MQKAAYFFRKVPRKKAYMFGKGIPTITLVWLRNLQKKTTLIEIIYKGKSDASLSGGPNKNKFQVTNLRILQL